MSKTKNVPQLRFKEFGDEWESYLFGEIADSITSGKSNQRKGEGEFPLYGSTGIIGYSHSYDYLGEKILIARVGANAGSLYKVFGKYCVTDNTLILNLKTSVNVEFVYNLLIHTNLNKLVFGSGQPLVTSGQLKRIVSIIPNIEEQTKIASFLTCVDDKIQRLKKKKALLEQYKKGVMQKLFSQELRFKDDDGKEFPEWEEKMLGETCSFFSGGTPLTTKREYFEGTIPFIRSGEISSSKTQQFISTLGLNNSSAKMVKVGDILYALYGATSGEVSISKIEGAINQAVLCIRSNQNHQYIYYNLVFKKETIISTFIQGGQGNLSADIIKKLSLLFPCLQEQTKIASFLSSLDEKIDYCQCQVDKMEVWKKGLLQKMFV